MQHETCKPCPVRQHETGQGHLCSCRGRPHLPAGCSQDGHPLVAGQHLAPLHARHSSTAVAGADLQRAAQDRGSLQLPAKRQVLLRLGLLQGLGRPLAEVQALRLVAGLALRLLLLQPLLALRRAGQAAVAGSMLLLLLLLLLAACHADGGKADRAGRASRASTTRRSPVSSRGPTNSLALPLLQLALSSTAQGTATQKSCRLPTDISTLLLGIKGCQSRALNC